MQLIHIETELTTAITDLILGLLAVFCLLLIFSRRKNFELSRKPWVWMKSLGLLAVAGFLGFFSHGFQISESLKNALWQPLYLSLGLTIAMFALAVTIDLLQKNPRRWMLPLFIAVAVGFYLVTLIIPDSFLVFILYEAAAMFYALFAYLYIAITRKKYDAFILAAGILISIAAAVFQAVDSVGFTLIWAFDHNGVFHLVQMVGVVVLTAGILAGAQKSEA